MAETFLEMPRETHTNQKENALAFAGTPAGHFQKHFGRYSALSKAFFRD